MIWGNAAGRSYVPNRPQRFRPLMVETEAALLREKDDCSQHRRCKAERDDAPTVEAVVFHGGRIIWL